MEIRLQLILIACIVNVWFESVQPDEKTDQYRNLLDSIANNRIQKEEIDRKILKQEVARERQNFDTMRDELRSAGRRNAFLKLKKTYRKINVARKRQIEPDPFTEISPGVRVFPENPVLTRLKITWKEICTDLINLNVEAFMERSVQAFNYTCQSMSYSHYMGYRNVYNDILATQFIPFNNGSEEFYTGLKPGLIAKNMETTFLLEFMVNGNASLAMAEIEKYKNNFYGSTPNILGIGINFHFVEAPPGYKNINASYIDRLRCDWEGKLYSKTGEVKKVYPHKVEILDCPA